jgi:serine protease AprX
LQFSDTRQTVPQRAKQQITEVNLISRKARWLMTTGLLMALLGMAVPSLASSTPGTGQEAAPIPAWEPEAGLDSPLFIHLRSGSFDPLQALPQLPDSLSYTPAEAAAAGVYIVQFTGPVMPAWKQAVTTAGGQLGDYLPDHAFLVHLDVTAKVQVEALPFVRWVGPYQPAYKLAPDVDTDAVRSYRVILAPWADRTATQAALTSLGVKARSYSQGFSAVLDGAQADQVARLADVLWVEPYYLQRAHNDVGGGTIMGGTTAWSNGYTGSGVTIAVADTGLDTGTASTIHQDFSGRVAHISSWPVVYINYGGGCEIANAGADDGAADVDSGHGTHVAGSVAGSGARSSGQFKGLGYEATVTFQAVEQYTTWTFPDPFFCPNGYWLTGIPDDVRDLLNEAYGWGARIHNNSWGSKVNDTNRGVYDEQAAQFDDFIHQHPDMTVVTSAGNAGADADRDGYVDENSTASPATAKNVITVGASENERSSGGYQYTWGQMRPQEFPVDPTKSDHLSNNREHLAAFSSRGPLADGRIKPDVVAPGTNVLSVRSSQAANVDSYWWGPYDAYYMYMGGTSMASPLAAGAATLVREYYVEGEGHANPSAALIKATLINSAVDISGYGNSNEEAGQPIPNNHEGWGRIDVGAATTPGKRQFVDNTGGVSTGASETYSYHIKPGQPFKVTLVWSDAAGSPGAGKALVNDLNLRVTAPGGTTTYWGNHFSGGWSQPGGSADTLNNVENVYVQAPTAGAWTVEIVGQSVPQGPQPFALVVDGDMSLAEVLTVAGIQPTRAPNNAPLTGAVVSGAGFAATSVVHLVHGTEVISGTNLFVDTEADTITVDLDLDGATPGLWDVRVTNPGPDTATLEDGLRVLDATLPDLRISKTAAESTVEPGSWLTYTIAIDNDGYVTATGVTFTDTLPSGVTFDRLSSACDGGVTVLPEGFACHAQGGSLSVGAGITYTLVVSIPEDARGTLVNRVVVGSVEADGYPGDNSDQESVIADGGTIYLPLVTKNWPPVPGAPTLYPIDDPGSDGDYTVRWAAGDGPAPSSYDLEENSAVILADYAGTSYDFSGKAVGTYTYRVRGKNSYATGPWSSEQSVSVASQDPIQNGDFENGPDGSWTEYSSNGYDLIVDSFSPLVYPHSGSWAVWLGGVSDEVSSITQQITVPSASSTLSFWYWIASWDDTCGNDFGQLRVGSTVIDTFDLCEVENTRGWVEHTADLSAYAGQSVSLQIRAETDSSQNSNFFIDDVVFE